MGVALVANSNREGVMKRILALTCLLSLLSAPVAAVAEDYRSFTTHEMEVMAKTYVETEIAYEKGETGEVTLEDVQATLQWVMYISGLVDSAEMWEENQLKRDIQACAHRYGAKGIAWKAATLFLGISKEENKGSSNGAKNITYRDLIVFSMGISCANGGRGLGDE